MDAGTDTESDRNEVPVSPMPVSTPQPISTAALVIDSLESTAESDDTTTGLQSMFKGETTQFREQIYTLTRWFGQWSDCEQTVALYTLLRQLDSRQARFIEHLLQEQASTDSNVDDFENQANNLDFVQSLDSVKYSQGELIQQLLKHFPLLHPGNESVKNEYLKIIPKAFSNSVENGTKVEDCRKLLTYTLIHPAVSNDERSQFTKWLGQLERQYSMKITQTQLTHSNIQSLSSYAEQIRLDSSSPSLVDPTLPQSSSMNNMTKDFGSDCVFTDVEVSSNHLPLHATSSAPPYGTSGMSVFNNNNHRKLSRTRSYANTAATPQRGGGGGTGSGVSGGDGYTGGDGYSSCGGSNSAGHWRSQTSQNAPAQTSASTAASEFSNWVLRSQDNLSPSHSDHGPLSPQSSLSSTDSDHEAIKTGVFYQENSGMKEFPGWLKGLRLHKYSDLFTNVPYEEMLLVDEKWLEERKVTKGARNKLAQSVAKLRERTADLRSMEQHVVQGTNLKQVLTDLKAIVHSPIKPYFPSPEGDNSTISSPTVSSSADLSDSDLPGLINRLMGRLCTQLLVNSKVDDECYPLYIHLIDKCMHHEAFTVKQRKLLQEWRSQVLQRNNGRMITGRQDQRAPSHRTTSRTSSWNPSRQGSISKGTAVYAQRAIQGQNMWYNSSGSFEKKPLTLTYSGPEHLNLPQPSHLAKPQGTKSAIHRTQSAPIRPQPVLRRTTGGTMVTEPDINESLDSLARSVTEAALSSQDSVDLGEGDDKTTSA